ncbi:MAG: hypothetical protein RQ745_12010 [Longimicrobiales bacterium]|nr:hypothetical protein [Longimicrobiales bacterium]
MCRILERVRTAILLAPLRVVPLLALAGCASIPQEAADLSHVVGQRLAAVQASHEGFARAYFQLSRDRVEDFLQRRWIPEFLATFVADADLAGELASPDPLTGVQEDRLREELAARLSLEGAALDRTVEAVKSGLGDADRGEIVLDFATAALEQIEAQRRELIGPINQMEADALRELRRTWAELIQAQAGVTAFIQSTHDVTAEQDAVLARLGMLEARDRVIEDAVSLSEEVVRITDETGPAQDVLRRLRERLGTAEPGRN